MNSDAKLLLSYNASDSWREVVFMFTIATCRLGPHSVLTVHVELDGGGDGDGDVVVGRLSNTAQIQPPALSSKL